MGDQDSYETLIGVHLTMHLMHPKAAVWVAHAWFYGSVRNTCTYIVHNYVCSQGG